MIVRNVALEGLHRGVWRVHCCLDASFSTLPRRGRGGGQCPPARAWSRRHGSGPRSAAADAWSLSRRASFPSAARLSCRTVISGRCIHASVCSGRCSSAESPRSLPGVRALAATGPGFGRYRPEEKGLYPPNVIHHSWIHVAPPTSRQCRRVSQGARR